MAKISTLSNVIVSQPQNGEKSEVRADQILRSDFIISLYSTVLLEASILNKKCIIPSFLLTNYVISGAQYIDDSPHYMGMSLLNNVCNAKTEKDFTDSLQIKFNDLAYEPNNSKILNWFCTDCSTSQEILNFIYNCNIILTKTKKWN
jgi:hypothetical protein